MARKKEIDKQRILDAAYKLAVRGGIESLTARNIARQLTAQPNQFILNLKICRIYVIKF